MRSNLLFRRWKARRPIVGVGRTMASLFFSSLFVFQVVPALVKGESIQTTDRTTFDNILRCLLSIEFVVAGVVAVILDNIFRGKNR